MQVGNSGRSSQIPGNDPNLTQTGRSWAHKKTQDKRKAFRAGAQRYLVEPSDGDELIAEIARLIRFASAKNSASPPCQITVNNL